MRRRFLWGSIIMSVFLGARTLLAQTDLKPAIRFNVDAGDWASDGSWDASVPGEGEIASVRNGGTAQVSSAVPTVDALSIANGMVDVGAGGVLDVSGAVVVGGSGTLGLSGGTVKSGSLSVIGSLSLGGGTIETDKAAFDASSTIDLPAGTNLAFGSSVPFLTAGSRTSQQPNFTVGGAAPELDRGLGLRLTPGGSVDVGSVPIAIVDRTSGNISLTNAGGGPLSLLGYSITSGNGLLAADAFTGQEQWLRANVADPASEFTEFSNQGGVPFAVGATIDLGNGWGGQTVSPREEDVALSVLLDDGTILDGPVEYTGPANDLVLNVDPATGAAKLQNLSPSVGDFNVVGYSILSASGSLNQGGFSGIGEDGWVIANPQASALGELNLSGSKVFGNGTVVELGNIFTPNGTQDLVLEFGIAGSDRAQLGTVEYGGGEVLCNPNTLGDVDGNGAVAFADFLILAENFGANQGVNHADGDIDCNGEVAFADFLILAENFGKQVGQASAVPEPSGVILLFMGFLGMLQFRKRGLPVAGLLIVAGFMTSASNVSVAAEFETQFIRLHPEGPNNQINDTIEARGILDGSVLDVILNEEIFGTAVTVDFGGGAGNFSNDQNPWGNGELSTGMNDFIQRIAGVITIPAGDWTVGFGSDDGGLLRFTNPDVTFINTFNENGPTIAGDGEIIANGTRGHDWTAGTITVPDGGITTGIESFMFERGGGDSFEVAYVQGHYDPAVDGDRNTFLASGFELDNGDFGDWTLEDTPFVAPGASNDLNGDGAVNADDYTYLAENWGGPLNFDTLFSLASELNAPAGAASNSVPEPASLVLLLSALTMFSGLRRRRRQ